MPHTHDSHDAHDVPTPSLFPPVSYRKKDGLRKLFLFPIPCPWGPPVDAGDYPTGWDDHHIQIWNNLPPINPTTGEGDVTDHLYFWDVAVLLVERFDLQTSTWVCSPVEGSPGNFKRGTLWVLYDLTNAKTLAVTEYGEGLSDYLDFPALAHTRPWKHCYYYPTRYFWIGRALHSNQGTNRPQWVISGLRSIVYPWERIPWHGRNPFGRTLNVGQAMIKDKNLPTFDAVWWAERFPLLRPSVRGYVVNSQDAFEWASLFPEDKDLVRHLIGWEAVAWAEKWPEDREYMRERVQPNGNQMLWLMVFPEDREYFRARGLARKSQGILGRAARFFRDNLPGLGVAKGSKP